jgi:tetraacyldisaccharide 4'-kinase
VSELLFQWLGRLYGAGVRAHSAAYKRGWLRRRRLPRPVISIGNLTAGGTGKTPLVRRTVEYLLQLGYRPAILIRGYRRERGPDAIVIPPRDGRAPEPREVGDEAAWLARALPRVPIGVSADRFHTGESIMENYPVDAFVLDDGFQHRQLARDLDVVALDATRGISDNEILPAGLQREPAASLARADVVVITRAELVESGRLEEFRRLVRGINPSVVMLEAATRLRCVRDLSNGIEMAAEVFVGQPVHGFCGVGNPDAFFRDLRLWGFDVVRESIFPDHHVYRDLNFARGGGVAAFLTTEKDAMNLAGVSLSAAGAPVLACVTRLEIEGENLLAEKFGLLLGRPESGRPKPGPGMEN